MTEQNPWKTLDSEEVYKNQWISVREDKVIRPDGNEGIYGVVTTRTAIGVVALNENKEVYLVGQYRYPTDQYSWEIPEGGDEDGESYLDTAKRELQEETGLTAKKWTSIGHEMHLSNCFCTEQAFIFLAEELSEGEQSLDVTEELEVKKMKFFDALDMALSGEIKDVISIVGLMLTERHLKNRERTGV